MVRRGSPQVNEEFLSYSKSLPLSDHERGILFTVENPNLFCDKSPQRSLCHESDDRQPNSNTMECETCAVKLRRRRWHADTRLVTVIISKLHQWQALIPTTGELQYTSPEHILKGLNGPL